MTELVIVSAADEAALLDEMGRLIGFLDRVPDVSLKDVAYTCSLVHGACAIAVIAADVPALRARLSSARNRLEGGNVRRLRDKSGTYYFRDHLLGEGKGKLAFVYPGVLGFYPAMMRDLAVNNAEFRAAFDELEEALAGDRDFTPSSFVFPPASYYSHDADIFSSGAYAQALVSTYIGCVGFTRLLKKNGLEPDGLVGFAGGDLAAMMRSGAAGETPSRPERVKMLADIYQIVHKAVDHGGLPKVAMLTVLLRREGEIDELVKSFPSDRFMLAVDFSPRQKTYAVAEDFEATATAALTEAGARVMKLALNRPFNTPLCKSMVPAIGKFASRWMRHDASVKVYSCATAEPLPGLRRARKDMGERWAKPVRFEETIRRMYADGHRVFLEVGPRGLMTGAVEDTLKGEEHAAIALNSIHRSGTLQAQHALGQLVALGAQMDFSGFFERRHARKLDFDSALSPEVRKHAEMKLSRAFPKLMLLNNETLQGVSVLAEPKGRGVKASARAAAVAQQARRQRQFDFGAMNPLVSDADTLDSSPGVSIEIEKAFKLADLPFVGDFALGTSQLSYSDPNLKGLVPLSLPVAIEIMAEVASLVVPNRRIVHVDDVNCRRMVSFEKGELRLRVLAERVSSGKADESAVKVQIRDDSSNAAAYTSPVMEATVVLADAVPPSEPVAVKPAYKPRSVHWSGRDIYPSRLCCGHRLRGVQFVETWGEDGIDYEIAVPPLAGNVAFTRFPIWAVNPLLLEIAASGFSLWRSHEKYTGAFSFPIRMRRVQCFGAVPKEGETLKCYARLTEVTPETQMCDITVTDGNGQKLVAISGWEELTERVPREYPALVLQPAVSFLTEPLSADVLGQPSTDIASAFITDVPYRIFERNEELWLKILSHIVLDAKEREVFAQMTGVTARRAEWLFGRLAAKECVRRYLKDYHQARWSDADINIWADGQGKPHVLGAWNDYLSEKIDIAIAHTAQFVVAVAAANARVGVDVELASRDLSKEFADGVFTPEEQELAAGTANAAQAHVKFWCAKEAVSKALGTGIRYSPKEMTVVGYQADSGALTVRLVGAWAEAFKNLKGRDISVTVRLVRDHALASCFLPATLFNED